VSGDESAEQARTVRGRSQIDDGTVLQAIVDAYTDSSDFNGILGLHLTTGLGISWGQVKTHLEVLIRRGLVEIVHTDWFPNPHVRPFDARPIEEQIDKLAASTPTDCCLYPAPEALKGKRRPRRYADRPYAYRLWKGAPQLRPVYFDLAVLDSHRSDPRYHFQFYGNGGMIGVRDEYYASSDFPERDKVLVQTFGVGYDDSGGRVVAVFLRYLADLSPEHQREHTSPEGRNNALPELVPTAERMKCRPRAQPKLVTSTNSR